jgi:hypothetical protein
MQLSSLITLLASLATISTTMAHPGLEFDKRQLSAINATALGNQTIAKEAPTDLTLPCICAPSKCPTFLSTKAVSKNRRQAKRLV